MSGRFTNKVVLVTGAGMGLGQAIALAFAREKANVIVSDIMIAEGEKTVRTIRETGGEALFIKTDVCKRDEIEAMVEQSIAAYGRIDCAINNAGVGSKLALTADLEEEEWDRIITTDLKSVWLCMKYEIPHMLKQGGGVIVNMSSASGLHGTPYQCSYSASKHGVLGLTKTVALEYAKSGIRANAICPGPIRTAGLADYFVRDPEAEARLSAGTPMGRVGLPAEIAETALWLCSDGASFITGQGILVDGGSSVVS